MKRRSLTIAAAFAAIASSAIFLRHHDDRKATLFTLRQVVDNYTNDKGQAPRSLQDLVSAGYLRSVPAGVTLGDVK
jgi:hypothetical protein